MIFDLIDIILGLSLALFLTISVELFVIYLFKLKSNKIILVAIVVNFFTNVTMNLLLRFVFSENYIFWLVVLEVIVFIIEAMAYYIVLKNYKKSFTLSLACNSASLAVILALNWIFSRNFIYTILWGFITGVVGLIGGWFEQPYYGAIVDIEAYTTEYVEIAGIYAAEYEIIDYFDISPTINYNGSQPLNSPAPVYLYYTIPVSFGDNVIMRFKVELADPSYQFDYISLNDQHYYEEDLVEVDYAGDYIYLDILYESIDDEDVGYIFNNIYYVSLFVDDEETKRVGLDLEYSYVDGYCFFFGALDQLVINKNENICRVNPV